MTGMIVSGASPVYGGVYQIIIVAMILAASGIAGMIVTLLSFLSSRAIDAPPTGGGTTDVLLGAVV
jgi:ABC-type iron transport system FetAB permease component